MVAQTTKIECFLKSGDIDYPSDIVTDPRFVIEVNSQDASIELVQYAIDNPEDDLDDHVDATPYFFVSSEFLEPKRISFQIRRWYDLSRKSVTQYRRTHYLSRIYNASGKFDLTNPKNEKQGECQLLRTGF